MKKIYVNLEKRSYSILIGINFLTEIGNYIGDGTGRKIAIVTQSNISKLYYAQIQKSLVQSGFSVMEVQLPDTEIAKSLETVSIIYDQILRERWERDFPILALGGGVVGDAAGFVASTILRGVPCYQVPTTLLAMVDSSVGGKTGLNHETGKNLIGTFYQPTAVFADIETLETLSNREFFSGLAEVVKYGLFADRDFFEYLTKHWSEILARDNKTLLKTIIQRCLEIKVDIVAKDECELGLRRILNFGHTIGHAIEKALGYGKILHGEAVWFGMVAAVKLSFNRGLLSNSDCKQIIRFLLSEDPKIQSLRSLILKHKSDVINAIQHDKKTIRGKITFVLLSEIGKTQIIENIPTTEIENIIN